MHLQSFFTKTNTQNPETSAGYHHSISDQNLKRHGIHGTKDIQAVIDGDQQGGTLLRAPEIHQAGAIVDVAGPIFKATSVYPN